MPATANPKTTWSAANCQTFPATAWGRTMSPAARVEYASRRWCPRRSENRPKTPAESGHHAGDGEELADEGGDALVGAVELLDEEDEDGLAGHGAELDLEEDEHGDKETGGGKNLGEGASLGGRFAATRPGRVSAELLLHAELHQHPGRHQDTGSHQERRP